jgi:hypothetical protein
LGKKDISYFNGGQKLKITLLHLGSNSYDRFNNVVNKQKTFYVTLLVIKITKNTNFKKQSFLIYIFEFSNNIIVKITANAVGFIIIFMK